MELSFFEKTQLLEHLRSFVTAERFDKFNRVLEQRTEHLCVVSENIFQSQNASAILRSCDCFGIQSVHIIEKTFSYSVNSDIAMGAQQWISLHYADFGLENNTRSTYDNLRKQGYRIAATCLHRDAESLYDLSLNQKTALVFGTELTGLTEEAINEADTRVYIPMTGFTESFNVSVAAALCLQHLSRKLKDSSIDWHLPEERKTDVLLEWLSFSIRSSDKIIEQWKDCNLKNDL